MLHSVNLSKELLTELSSYPQGKMYRGKIYCDQWRLILFPNGIPRAGEKKKKKKSYHRNTTFGYYGYDPFYEFFGISIDGVWIFIELIALPQHMTSFKTWTKIKCENPITTKSKLKSQCIIFD